MTRSQSSASGKSFRGTAYLLTASLMWGVAFVPQRVASQHIDAFTFNAVKYLCAAVLMAALFLGRLRSGVKATDLPRMALLGFLLFAGSVLQQIGVASTTAGKAGFITGLYMVMVPILRQLVLRASIPLRCWAGALLSTAGLALLSLNGSLTSSEGDLWVLGSALLFSLHILCGDRFVTQIEPIPLATGQYLFCGLLSLIGAASLESPALEGLAAAAPALAYMVVFSTGVGYTLALAGQRYVHPEIAALIMSLEAVFAALAGLLLLGELLTPAQACGCLLMLLGIFAAQGFKRDFPPNSLKQKKL